MWRDRAGEVDFCTAIAFGTAWGKDRVLMEGVRQLPLNTVDLVPYTGLHGEVNICVVHVFSFSSIDQDAGVAV